MYQKGLDLSQQAFELEKEPNSEKKENLSKTSQGLSRVKELVENRIEEIKNTKNEEISKEKISEIRGNLNTTFEPNAQLYYWLPDGVQLVIIEVIFSSQIGKYFWFWKTVLRIYRKKRGMLFADSALLN